MIKVKEIRIARTDFLDHLFSSKPSFLYEEDGVEYEFLIRSFRADNLFVGVNVVDHRDEYLPGHMSVDASLLVFNGGAWWEVDCIVLEKKLIIKRVQKLGGGKEE